MDFLILGIGIGLWMYSFVNHRYNEKPWISSSIVFGVGFVVVIVGLLLHFLN